MPNLAIMSTFGWPNSRMMQALKMLYSRDMLISDAPNSIKLPPSWAINSIEMQNFINPNSMASHISAWLASMGMPPSEIPNSGRLRTSIIVSSMDILTSDMQISGEDADFRGAQFQGSADFRDSILHGDSDFQETKYGTDFDVRGMKFSILMVDWPSIADYVISDGPVYLQLIKNFKNLEQFDDANSCYYKYRLFSMDKRSWSDKEKYLDALAWLTCGFGVRPSFTVLWMMIMIVLFAILYWAIDVFKEQPYPFARQSPPNMQKATIMDAATDIFRELPPQSCLESLSEDSKHYNHRRP